MLDGYIPGPVTTLFGETIAGTITGVSPHDWWADGNGLFHTDADLAAEWKDLYVRALAGEALNPIQHLEANAEAVFELTGLAKLSVGEQARDREDAQRVFDAIGAAMTRLGLTGSHPFTVQEYVAIGRTIQSDAVLSELGIQGHGLNSPPLSRYDGYTNHFQNGVDRTTLWVSGGLENNENALTDFFDDMGISHLPFPAVVQNGKLVQLNQNGANENDLVYAVGALDDAAFWKIWTAKDFSATPSPTTLPMTLPPEAGIVAPRGFQLTLFGDVVPTKVTISTSLTAAHTWVADSTGLYHTTANLAGEWLGYYRIMLAGGGDTLTAIQRAEGNAEAIFQNTGIGAIVKADAALSKQYREDVQRDLDAIAAAAAAAGWDGHADLTNSMYLKIGHALQNNALWLELSLQGHGLNSPPAPRYNGYTRDFQDSIDDNTLFIGAGPNMGESALPELFDDSILSHLAFPVVAQNGELRQLNQNANSEQSLWEAVEGLNSAWLHTTYTAADFYVPGGGRSAILGDFLGFYGDDIAKVQKLNGHNWVAGTDGLFHTATDLAAEWQKYYRIMLAGKGDTLTATQRWEGNAEAVFEFTTLASQQPSVLVRDREDVQRMIDAAATVMTSLGLNGNVPLSAKDLLSIEQTLQANPVLREMALQGHGLNNPSLPRYNGYTNDMQWADWQTYFVGGGLDNARNALSTFFDDAVATHMAFPVIGQNGHLEQLNQNGGGDDTLANTLTFINATLYQRVYVASDFSMDKTAVGAVVWVPGAQALTPAALPEPGPGQMSTLFGDIVPTTLVLNGHTWVADANGLYHTDTDLKMEWYNYYQAALAGAPLTGLQHLQANAEAVFEFTGLADLNEQVQDRDREDFQRELDAIWEAMGRLGLSYTAPLSNQAYLAIQHVIERDGALHELALQGHGLNSPPAPRYRGYTNDFQNNVDQKTIYIGGGLTTGERAVADLFDDRIISHLLYPVVIEDGQLIQLNQNGANENTLQIGVLALNEMMFSKVLTTNDFIIPGRGVKPAPAPLVNDGSISTLLGDEVPGTIVVNGHAWVADANGLYHTATNLEIEWRSLHLRLLAGDTTLTAVQRLEANAEAIFENTSLSGGPDWVGHANEIRYREDVQRMLDAIGEAMAQNQATLGIDPTKPLTTATYMALANAIQGSTVLAELALQGVGQSSPVASRYNGFTIDILNWGNPIDRNTLYVGGGLDNNMNALSGLLADGIVGQLLNPVVYQGGTLMQFDNKLAARNTLSQAVVALDDMMFFHTLHNSDFSQVASSANVGYVSPAQAVVDAAAAAKAPAGSFVGLYGDAIARRQVVSTGLTNNHVWLADATGLFHTSTDLAAEWQKYYGMMVAGKAKSLTIIQRLEGNAEAIFENTAIATASAAQQQAWREDVQRALDAMALALYVQVNTLGVDAKAAPTMETYLGLERALQGNVVATELYMQGHGLSGAASGRYSGYVNDFRNLDSRTWTTLDWSNAVSQLMDHSIIGNLGFEAGVWGWNTNQLNEKGQVESSLMTAVAQFQLGAGGRAFRSYDFRH